MPALFSADDLCVGSVSLHVVNSPIDVILFSWAETIFPILCNNLCQKLYDVISFLTQIKEQIHYNGNIIRKIKTPNNHSKARYAYHFNNTKLQPHADDILKFIFMCENYFILIQISLNIAQKFHRTVGNNDNGLVTNRGQSMGLLPDTQNCVLYMRWECRERFPRHRWLAIPTCITTRASRTCRDACRDR